MSILQPQKEYSNNSGNQNMPFIFFHGGGGEIRTRVARKSSGFQDRCNCPLCDSTNALIIPAL